MKKLIFAVGAAALIAACSTPSPQKQMVVADASSLATFFPSKSGTWRYSNQFWSSGDHFCEYRNGNDTIVVRIETFESCPPKIEPQ